MGGFKVNDLECYFFNKFYFKTKYITYIHGHESIIYL